MRKKVSLFHSSPPHFRSSPLHSTAKLFDHHVAQPDYTENVIFPATFEKISCPVSPGGGAGPLQTSGWAAEDE